MVATPESTLTGHRSCVNGVAVFPDCSRIVSGSDDMSVKIWDAKSGLELFKLTGHIDDVNGVAVFSDCSRIVSGSTDGSVKIWNMLYYPAKSVFILLMKLPLNEDVVKMITKYCIAPKYQLEALWN